MMQFFWRWIDPTPEQEAALDEKLGGGSSGLAEAIQVKRAELASPASAFIAKLEEYKALLVEKEAESKHLLHIPPNPARWRTETPGDIAELIEALGPIVAYGSGS